MARWFATHDGMITVRQAAALDLTPSEIFGRTSRGEWLTVVSGIYRLASSPFTERAMVRAAAWAHRGVLDRTTAAWWHGLLPELPAPLTLSMTYTARQGRWTGCEVDVKRRSFCAEDLAEVDGVPVAGKELSVLGAVASVDDPADFVERLLFRNEVTVASLADSLERNRGMHGLGPAWKLITLLDSDTQGKAERLFRELLVEHEITGCVQQYGFQGWLLDFAWPELKVVVEIDGFAYHRDHKAFRRDMNKRNALTLNGWLVLNFSYHDVADDPLGCLETLAAALDARLAMTT